MFSEIVLCEELGNAVEKMEKCYKFLWEVPVRIYTPEEALTLYSAVRDVYRAWTSDDTQDALEEFCDKCKYRGDKVFSLKREKEEWGDIIVFLYPIEEIGERIDAFFYNNSIKKFIRDNYPLYKRCVDEINFEKMKEMASGSFDEHWMGEV